MGPGFDAPVCLHAGGCHPTHPPAGTIHPPARTIHPPSAGRRLPDLGRRAAVTGLECFNLDTERERETERQRQREKKGVEREWSGRRMIYQGWLEGGVETSHLKPERCVEQAFLRRREEPCVCLAVCRVHGGAHVCALMQGHVCVSQCVCVCVQRGCVPPVHFFDHLLACVPLS